MEEEKKPFFKKVIALIGVVFGFIYLLNPTMGLFELLPDTLPIIGNLDEGAAVYLIFAGLRYLGIDILKYFDRIRK
ncbi:DUF1232 domain-containing protein [Halobacteriovorax marinus]|uniref:Membrane protein n=1 Tax=Halobacteriovorax marinus (strain ATCC BAA-682 / DSM 15412 / SJ) TaxID=862908 RepID=E1WX54_HALMS|nr:DUF1232 domain-containing protein [Halobacteriovorax marinus]ATH07141.1 DUF1232 domain-containing protein [Halobacteriovorax marinus]CBW25755.1 putative membrane protein [Halobacteriovorax marinus SJ]